MLPGHTYNEHKLVMFHRFSITWNRILTLYYIPIAAREWFAKNVIKQSSFEWACANDIYLSQRMHNKCDCSSTLIKSNLATWSAVWLCGSDDYSTTKGQSIQLLNLNQSPQSVFPIWQKSAVFQQFSDCNQQMDIRHSRDVAEFHRKLRRNARLYDV